MQEDGGHAITVDNHAKEKENEGTVFLVRSDSQESSQDSGQDQDSWKESLGK